MQNNLKSRRKTERDTLNLENANIFELIETLGDIRREEKTPTARHLAETGGKPVISRFGCTVFRNGYALYSSDGRNSVVWLPDCTEFTCWFVQPLAEERGIVPDKVAYDMSEFPWMFAVILRGEARLNADWMNFMGYGDRKRWYPRTVGKSVRLGTVRIKEIEDAQSGSWGTWRGVTHIPGPEEVVIFRDTVRDAMEQLTERERTMFLQYYYYGYSMEEVGEMQGITQGSVSICLRKASEKLSRREAMLTKKERV